MNRVELVRRLSSLKTEILTDLASRRCWGAADSEVWAGLEAVLDDFLAAVSLGSSGLLDRCFTWWKVRVRALGGEPGAAAKLPTMLAEVIADRFVAEDAQAATCLLRHAEAFVRRASDWAATGAALHPALADGELGDLLVQALLAGDRIAAGKIVADESLEPSVLLTEGFEPALREIGARWQNGKVDPGVEHVASRVASEFIARVARRVPAPPAAAPMVAMMLAAGDEHSLGLDCLRIHFALAGLRCRVVTAVPDRNDILAALEASRASAIAISCMRPAQLPQVRELVTYFRISPGVADLPVLVGGGMFADVPQLAAQIGADATAIDGAQAAEELSHMLADANVPQ